MIVIKGSCEYGSGGPRHLYYLREQIMIKNNKQMAFS